MPEGNPLVAAPQETTTGVTGIGIAESCVDVANGVSNGDWVEAGLGILGAGLEVLSMVIDPLGTLASYGVSWLIEHVRPLKEALDWFAGDPPVIRAFSETWANIAGEVDGIAVDFATEATGGTAGWTGAAADAYRTDAAETADAVAGAGVLASGISAGVMIMGEVVAFVREFIRDLVGELVGRLISWALEVACTLGLATPLVVAQATSAIAKVVNKVADLVRKLVKTIGNVAPRLRKVIDKLDEIIQKLSKLGRGADGGPSTTPSAARGGGKPDAPELGPNKADGPDGTGPDGPGATGTPGSPNGTTSPSGTRPGRDGGANRPDDPSRTDKPHQDLNTCNDPVDVATGQVVLAQTDVRLPGVLPLVLRRVHQSSYRAGRLFGPSWASTVDQRLELDEQGVVFVGDDGIRLVYPDPPVEGRVLPESGPRWPLSRTGDGGFTIVQRESARTLHFAAATAGVAELDAVVDRNGNRYDLERDGAGVVSAMRHSGGYHVLVDTSAGLVTGLRLDNPHGEDIRLVRFTYDEDARLVAVVNSSGLPLTFTYDHAGRLTEWADRNGMWYRYRYDGQGRCVANEGAGGYLDGSFAYDHAPDGSGTTRFTDALGHTSLYHLDHRGHTVAETDPLGNTTTYERDERGRVLTETDPLGRSLRREYDEDGNLVRATMPDGTQALAEYDELGLPLVQVDPDGAVWRYEYDERGNTVATTDAAGNVTRYGHDRTGAQTRRVDALGGVETTVNDAAGLPVAITDQVGGTVRYSRDQLGRLASVTDPLGGTTTVSWSVEGRLLSRTNPDGGVERWAYDGEGCLVARTDAAGGVTRREIVGFDLVAADIDETGARTEYTYDANLRLVAVTNAQGLVWRYEYDAAGNLVRETDFNGRVVTYEHDAAGLLVRRTNGAGQVVRFARDAMGRVVERRTDHAVTTFEFDPAGRLRRAVNADAELVVRHDALGDVVAETVDGRTVTSRYDALRRRTERLTPTGARSVWDYDPASRAVRLRSGGRTVSFGYDSAGRETERRLDTGSVLAQGWDAGHRLVSQTVTAGRNRLVQQRTYRYRPDDQLSAVSDRLTGTRHFDLDPHGRILGVAGQDRAERYAYDRAGNLAAAQWPGEQEAQGPRRYQGTLLRGAGTSTYHYDAQGRVVTRVRTRLSRKPDVWQFTWDVEDRLTAVRTPDGAVWRYRYDALGRRIAKQRLAADGSVAEQTLFAWDGVRLAEQVHSHGRATSWDFAPHGQQPLTQVERVPVRNAPQAWVDAAFYAIVSDLIGAPAELLDPGGDIAWHAHTTVWGQALARVTQRTDTPLRFPGQYFDPETGLHYNHYRYYDPENAGYLSSDPLGLAAGPNPRGYVPNPQRFADPLGLLTCDEARDILQNTDPYDPAHAAERSRAWRHLHRQPEPPPPPTTDEVRRGLINEARNAVRRGRGIPNELEGGRVDIPRDGGSQIHVQGRGNGSGGLNYDGTFRHEDPDWNRRTYEWLYDHGWAWPQGGRHGGRSPGTHEW